MNSQNAQANMPIKKKTQAYESDEEDDPATLARIKQLEKGRQGFSPLELSKLKYNDNMEEIMQISAPYNQKLDSGLATGDDGKNPEVIFGPRSTDCQCCDMKVSTGNKFLFLKCCRSLYHQKCIGVWLMCQKFCPNKKCSEMIRINQYCNA